MCENCDRMKHDILVMNMQLSEETLKRFRAEKRVKELEEFIKKGGGK